MCDRIYCVEVSAGTRPSRHASVRPSWKCGEDILRFLLNAPLPTSAHPLRPEQLLKLLPIIIRFRGAHLCDVSTHDSYTASAAIRSSSLQHCSLPPPELDSLINYVRRRVGEHRALPKRLSREIGMPRGHSATRIRNDSSLRQITQPRNMKEVKYVHERK